MLGLGLFVPEFSYSRSPIVPSTNVQSIDSTINKMSLEQKVGQLFIFGYAGSTMSRTFSNKFRSYKPGGIIAFKRNIKTPEQIASLNFDLQKLSIDTTGLPAFIMVDQEGGTVTRIKSRPAPPSALAMGEADNPELTQKVGLLTGKILDTLGFNMNLAPVVDLSDPFINNFIGNRAFGPDPQAVKVMGENFARGLQASGIIPTLKHFPGHGGIVQDSHHTMPKKLIGLEELEKSDLVPFAHLANTKLPSAIMVAHVAFPNIDPSGLPATYSKVLVEQTLRGKMGYEGLIITDDIEMTGAEKIQSVGERAIAAIEAGCDMIMVAWQPRHQKAAVSAVVDAVKAGRLPMARIDQSVRRIVALKMGLSDKKLPDRINPKQLKIEMNRYLSDLKLVTNEISVANMEKSLRGYSFYENSIDSLVPLVVMSADYQFYTSIKKSIPNPVEFVALKRGQKNRLESLLNKKPQSLGIFYVTGVGTARILKNLDPEIKNRIFVINSYHPAVVENTRHYRAVININTRNYSTGQWIANYLIENDRLPAEQKKKSERSAIKNH